MIRFNYFRSELKIVVPIKLQLNERKKTYTKARIRFSTDNLYFVTICVQDRICCFGEIRDGKMFLNDLGKIANDQFLWLNDQYVYVEIHEFVIMPDHVHAIIEINRNMISSDFVGNGHDRSPENNPDDRSLQSQSIKIKPLSELLGAYKSRVSKQIHDIGLSEFQWQKSFHDRIVRDANAYDRIRHYIIDNPKNWKKNAISNIL